MANPRMTAEIGRVLGGRYRLVAPIGMGASAQVYLADDVRLRRRVALKMLHDALAGDSEFLRRFRAEARAAAALNHPNVMAVYDWGDEEVAFIATEYLSGGSLRALLDRGELLTPSQALTVGLDATRALDYAHRRGFVHRDIKPANLLFGEEQRLRIADFGLARALAEAAWTEPAGAMLGTARYASPEQAKGEKLSGKADVYSLALVLVEAVTGEVPFAADTTLGTLMARVDKHLDVPEALGPLREVLARAAHPDPEQRIDARTLAAGLLRAAKALPRPGPLPLAGALPPAGEVVPDLDPTVHAPIAGVMASAPAAVPDLTAEDLDLDPPDWVNRAEPFPVTSLGPLAAGVPLASATPRTDPPTTGLLATPSDADTGDVDVVGPSSIDPEPEREAVVLNRASNRDSNPDSDPSSGEAGGALAGAGAASHLPLVEPAWGDSSGSDPHHDPVDRVVDPNATAFIPPIVIDDYADRTGADPAGGSPAYLDPLDGGSGAGRPRRRWPWAVLAAVVLAGAGGIAAATIVDKPPAKPERTVVLPLPNLVNRSIDEAKAVAAASGWKVSAPVTTRLDGTLKGQVLASSPSAGTRLRPGASIRFTVSEGQTIVAVPLDELPGRSVADATAVLAAAGFPASASDSAYSEEIDVGLVVAAVESTTPTAEKGSTIGLVVSKGPAPRTVPGGLVGGTQTGAKAALEAERLKMATVGTFSDSIPEGQVISVLPKSGTTVPRDSVVNVEVSKGPELRAIPSIARAKSIDEAVAILRSAGFKDGSLSGPAAGKPKRTSPAAGTMARPGSTVNIITG